MGREHSFLLESAEQDGEMGRYSFIGFDPIEVLEFDENEDPLKLIKEKMESYEVEEEVREGLMAGFVGYFSYEVIHHVEDIPKSEKKAGMDIPEGIFFLPRVVICFDHLKHVAKLHYLVGEGEKEDGMNEILAQIQAPLQIPFIEPSEGVTDYELEPGRDEFIEQVKKCKRYIEEGEVFQIVVSHSIVAKTKRSSFELYRGLRHANPSPYMYFLQFEGFAVVGASPE
ncbi:hypothetical protein HN680_05705, partial [Candidatus Peregrinibacteria bacterium]|nr:hypothetical protein [Candidatus Peregrinibacteria bacterium]